MLFLVGLGLGGVNDVTIRGLEIIRGASRVYLEAYTSILTGVDQEELVKELILYFYASLAESVWLVVVV